MSDRRLRVLLADDHAPTRDDIARVIGRDERFEVCAAVADAAAAVAAALRERPDLCVLDVTMPGGGIAATWEIAARLPHTKIVMLTVSSDDADLFASLRAGAVSYLLKDADPRRLPDALHDVWEGRAVIPPTLVARMVDEFRSRDPRRRAIAIDAQPRLLSQSAVRAHISSILQKLAVESREGAVASFRALGERSA